MKSEGHAAAPPLSEKEFKTLVELARKALWSDPEQRRRLQAAKVNVVPSNFYSNIPSVEEIEGSFEQRFAARGPYHSPRLFDAARMGAFMEELRPFAEEFRPPDEGDDVLPQGYFWNNGAFTSLDAAAYYCVIRRFRPQRIVEVGSGYSTLVADAALKRNGSGSQVLIEPYPKPWLDSVATVETIHRKAVQEHAPEELLQIVESADLWFIDSTHTVKIGSDCLMLYLMVMPELRKDMLIHSHDVFLPFGFPPRKALERHIYWTEQYLLYAYLLDNPRAEVLFGSKYASVFQAAEAARLLPAGRKAGGGSLWYRLKRRSE